MSIDVSKRLFKVGTIDGKQIAEVKRDGI